MEHPVEGAIEELLLSIPTEEHSILQCFTGEVRDHKAPIRRSPKAFSSELHENGAHEPYGRGMMREVAEVMLESAAERCSEFVPREGE